MIESMCVVCHGPVAPRRATQPTAIICWDNGGTCMAVWCRLKRGGALPAKYVDLRLVHAYRRELLATELRLGRLLNTCYRLAAC